MRDVRKNLWKLYKTDPLYFRKHDSGLIMLIVVFYIWFLDGSLRQGRPAWFQITYKIFELIASAYLWFILGFRTRQNIKIPEEDNTGLPSKAD
jgi:hypothetical protein